MPSVPATPDRNVFVYFLDDQGGMTPAFGSPFASGGRIDDVESLSALVSGDLIFMGNSLSNSFSVLQLDVERGEVLAIPGSPFRAEGMHPAETVVSPEGTLDGQFLFVGNARSNTVSTFKLRDDGVPSPSPSSPTPTGGELIEGMAIHPTGQFLFINNGDSDDVSVLQVASDGALTPIAGSPFAGVFKPDEVVVHPNGNFIFVTNRDTC